LKLSTLLQLSTVRAASRRYNIEEGRKGTGERIMGMCFNKKTDQKQNFICISFMKCYYRIV
jgi:hypothetical protein